MPVLFINNKYITSVLLILLCGRTRTQSASMWMIRPVSIATLRSDSRRSCTCHRPGGFMRGTGNRGDAGPLSSTQVSPPASRRGGLTDILSIQGPKNGGWIAD
ncbi:hypothetical protein FRB94_008085 [Tulasnella sp. JGI-2019a]|nr:hypothetical protein FRB94_008085 [Tulasnella sp. JGI-2019a]